MGLKEKTASSVKWNTIATFVTMTIQVLQLAILTRLLDKSDFGLIAIASMVISFTDLFSEMGITVALVHKQNITKEVYSSVYWLNIGVSIVIYAITAALAPLVARFYGEPLLTKIVVLLALKIVLNGFGKMFHTIKQKDLDFGFISRVKVIIAIIGLLVTVGFAYFGYGVMSLVYGQLISIGINQLIFAIAGMRQQKILFHFSFHEVKDVLSIGGYHLGTQILDFVAARLDVLLIGKFFTMSQLGVYNIAKDLILKPFHIINSISSSVFSAAFAKIQNNLSAVVFNYNKLIKVVSIITLPIYCGLFIFADLLVAILYAPSFADVAIFIRILSLVGICSSLTSQAAPVLVALGRTDLGLRWTIVRVILATTVLLITCQMSVYAVAYGQSSMAVLTLFLYFFLVIKPMIKISLSQYCKMFGDIVVVTIIMTIPFAIINICFNVSLAIKIVMGIIYVAIYLCYINKYQKKVFQEVIKSIVSKKHN